MKKVSKENQAALSELFTELDDLAVQYNEKLQEIHELRDEIREEMQTYFDEKSEKWQESDAGQDFQTWIESWEEDVAQEAVESSDVLPMEP